MNLGRRSDQEEINMNTEHKSLDTIQEKISSSVHSASVVADGRAMSSKEMKNSVNKMLARLAYEKVSGNKMACQKLIRLYLRSFAARLAAVHRASERRPFRWRPTSEQRVVIAEALNAWAGTTEDVTVVPQEKKGQPGSYRTIMKFGIEHRSLQELLRPLLEVLADIRPNQYVLNGGLPAAIRRAADLMADGYVWAIETDITNCFESFDGEAVPELLPIPKEVTRRILLSQHLSLRLPTNQFGSADSVDEEEVFIGELFPNVRRGIPQGSCVSSLVAEMLLAPSFDDLPQAGASIGYADNVLAMGRTEDDALAMTLAFWSGLSANPAGHLMPKPCKHFEPGMPIEFLGHTLTLVGSTVRIEPNPAKVAQFEKRCKSDLKDIKGASSKTGLDMHVKNSQRYVMGWVNGFQACDGMDGLRQTAMANIEAAKSKATQSIKKVA
jgi:hypothetical protein